MKAIKQNFNNILLSLFELVVGILLLIDPVGFTSGIIVAAGVIMLVVGIINIVHYFRTEVNQAAAGQFFLKGLLSLLIGGFCVFNYYWFVATFSVLTIIYGIAVLVAGLEKIQLCMDMLRMKKQKWYFAIISAVISITCAVLILRNPFGSVNILWIFTGISLIAEGVFDVIILTINLISKNEKEQEILLNQDEIIPVQNPDEATLIRDTDEAAPVQNNDEQQISCDIDINSTEAGDAWPSN